jgi:transcriptional regulator with XRE-family HTH domain
MAPSQDKTLNSRLNEPITARQCRAARGLLGISQRELADAASVSLSAILDFETGTRNPRAATLAALRRAFEDAGVVFIPINGGGQGVRLRDPDYDANAGRQQANPGTVLRKQ